MTDLEILGLGDGATKSEIKDAWRKLASSLHPDRGGDATEFVRVRKAYERAYEKANDKPKCPDCLGSGKIKTAKGFAILTKQCNYCKGTGFV